MNAPDSGGSKTTSSTAAASLQNSYNYGAADPKVLLWIAGIAAAALVLVVLLVTVFQD